MLREHGETAFTGMHQYDMRQIHYQGFSLEFADMQTKVYDVRITNDGTIVDRYKLHCETQYSWPIYDAKAPPWQVRWFDKKTGQEIPLRPNDTWGERAASLQTPAMKPGEAHEYRLEVTPRVTTGNTYFSVFAESISDPGNYDVLTATCNIHIRVSCDLWVHTDDGKIAGKGTRLRHEDFSCEIPAPGTKTIYFTVLNDCEFTTDFYIGFDSFWQCTWKAVYGPNNTPEDSFGTACIRTPVLKPGESYTVRALVTAPAKYEQFERKIISASAGPVIRGADELIDSNTAFLYPNKHLSVLSPPPGPEVKLEANPGSGAVAGTTVTLTASPTLNDAYEYSFYIDEGTGWRCVRPYDRATMYHWTPVNAGTYGLRVCLRKAGGSAEDASATIPGYVVTNPPVTADNPPPVVTFR
jgi:hypothetical protein